MKYKKNIEIYHNWKNENIKIKENSNGDVNEYKNRK